VDVAEDAENRLDRESDKRRRVDMCQGNEENRFGAGIMDDFSVFSGVRTFSVAL